MKDQLISFLFVSLLGALFGPMIHDGFNIWAFMFGCAIYAIGRIIYSNLKTK